jgi:hypothetical protein
MIEIIIYDDSGILNGVAGHTIIESGKFIFTTFGLVSALIQLGGELASKYRTNDEQCKHPYPLCHVIA